MSVAPSNQQIVLGAVLLLSVLADRLKRSALDEQIADLKGIIPVAGASRGCSRVISHRALVVGCFSCVSAAKPGDNVFWLIETTVCLVSELFVSTLP